MRLLRLFVVLAALPAAFSCQGPAASDVEVCRDAIHRLCLPPRCSRVSETLLVSNECENELLTRTGCDADAFTFSSPTRAQFLDCRAGLLRNGDEQNAAPSCDDIEITFNNCPDWVAFFSPRSAP